MQTIPVEAAELAQALRVEDDELAALEGNQFGFTQSLKRAVHMHRVAAR